MVRAMSDTQSAPKKRHVPRSALFVVVPPSVHKRVRVAAADRDETVTQLVARAVERELQRLGW